MTTKLKRARGIRYDEATTKAVEKLLPTMSNEDIMRKLGPGAHWIGRLRRKLGVPKFTKPGKPVAPKPKAKAKPSPKPKPKPAKPAKAAKPSPKAKPAKLSKPAPAPAEAVIATDLL